MAHSSRACTAPSFVRPRSQPHGAEPVCFNGHFAVRRFETRADGAHEVARSSGAVAIDLSSSTPAAICCDADVAVVSTAKSAKVYRLGVPRAAEDAYGETDELPADPPSFDLVAVAEFDSAVHGVFIDKGLMAAVHQDCARLYQLPSAPDAGRAPVAEDSEEGEATVLEPWLTAAVGAAPEEERAGDTDEEQTTSSMAGVIDFIRAPVNGSVVGGQQRTEIVGMMLYWQGSTILRRYELPVLGMAAPESSQIVAKFEWSCSSPITASAMDPATTLYLTGHADGGVAVWDVRLAVLHRMLPPHTAEVTALAFARDPLVISVCGGNRPRLQVSDLDSGLCGGVLDGAVSCWVMPNRRTALCTLCSMPEPAGDEDRVGVVDLGTVKLLGILSVDLPQAQLFLRGSLLVEVASVSNLANADEAAVDPYCNVALGGHGQTTAIMQDATATVELPLLDVNAGLAVRIFAEEFGGDEDSLA